MKESSGVLLANAGKSVECAEHMEWLSMNGVAFSEIERAI